MYHTIVIYFFYFQHAETKTPEYNLINYQFKSYDFALLENYQSYVHKTAKILGIDVENCWATPLQSFKIQRLGNNSTVVDTEYFLKVYERNIQVVDVKSHIMPLFLEAVITSCPPGVTISVHEHTQKMSDIRYVPDYEVLDLQKQLDEIGDAKKRKKK